MNKICKHNKCTRMPFYNNKTFCAVHKLDMIKIKIMSIKDCKKHDTKMKKEGILAVPRLTKEKKEEEEKMYYYDTDNDNDISDTESEAAEF